VRVAISRKMAKLQMASSNSYARIASDPLEKTLHTMAIPLKPKNKFFVPTKNDPASEV
jgi:hypothetical protein